MFFQDVPIGCGASGGDGGNRTARLDIIYFKLKGLYSEVWYLVDESEIEYKEV